MAANITHFFAVGPRLTLTRQVIQACTRCGAPGVYQCDARFDREKWPALWNPDKAREPVGDVCPQCNFLRPPNKPGGEQVAFEWSLARRMAVWTWRQFFPLNPMESPK
jgi:hypothetical protein